LGIKANIDFSKYINILLVIHAFALPVSKALNVATTILLILLWMIEGNFKKKIITLKKDYFLLALTALVFYSLLSVLWNPGDKLLALEYIQKYYHFLIIPIIITSLKVDYIKPIISAFLLAIAISEVMSYGIFLELWQYKDVLPSDPSPFMGHTDYSVYLAFTLMILLSRVFELGISLKVKLFYVFSFLLVTSNLFINGGRTGQVLFLVSVFILAYFQVKNKFLAISVSLLLMTTLVLGAYNISPNFHKRANDLITDVKLVTNKDFTKNFGQRVSFWYIGSHIFYDNFFLGTGINNGTRQLTQYNEKLQIKTINFEGTIVSDVHNIFLMYAIQLGIIGLILISLVFYFLFKSSINSPHKYLHFLFVFIFFGFSNVGNTLHTLDSMVLFAMFTGVFEVISRSNYTKAL